MESKASMVVAEFEKVVSQMPLVIADINKRFPMGVRLNESVAVEKSEMFAKIDARYLAKRDSINEMEISRPSRLREELKQSHANVFDAEGLTRLFKHSEELYEKFLAQRGT
jgi:hypothetical protein